MQLLGAGVCKSYSFASGSWSVSHSPPKARFLIYVASVLILLNDNLKLYSHIPSRDQQKRSRSYILLLTF